MEELQEIQKENEQLVHSTERDCEDNKKHRMIKEDALERNRELREK